MSESIHEILPGVVHWAAKHPNIGADVSSYALVEERVVLNPIAPPDGLEWFEGKEPKAVLLTNRHHLRDAEQFAERFGATIHAIRAGIDELPDSVQAFDFGDDVPGGGKAIHVLDEWPDETAIAFPRHALLAVADGVLNYGGLGFAPDEHLGDDPDAVKRQLRAAFGRVAEEVEFEHLLLAHGAPVIGDGREQLRRFAAG